MVERLFIFICCGVLLNGGVAEVGASDVSKENIQTLLDKLLLSIGGKDEGQTTTTVKTLLETQSPISETIKAKLDALDKEISVLENYVKGEKSTDAILQDLEGSTYQEVLGYMDTVKNRAAETKEKVKMNLKPAEEILSGVKTLANNRNVVVGGILYYGAIGSACSSWENTCKTSRSECRDNKCQCVSGLSFDALQQTCVETCQNGYGNTYQTVTNYAIRGFNNLVLENVTLDTCKQTCETVDSFVCRSFDYFRMWNSCYLSRSVKADTEQGEYVGLEDYVVDDEGEDKDGWEYNAAAVHFQRDCIVDAQPEQ